MNSYGYGSSEEHQPLTWVRGYPVYAAHALVAVFVVSMVATAICLGADAHGFLNLLPFRSDRVLSGEIWRIATYGFFNRPSIWFAIEMVMIVWFGRELEKFYGRRKFFILYAGLYFLPPLVLTVFGFWQPNMLAGRSGSFGQQGHFSFPTFRRPIRAEPREPVSRRSEGSRNHDSVRPSTMAEVDALLDKIAQLGIHSLTPKERAKLDAARSEMQKRSQGRP